MLSSSQKARLITFFQDSFNKILSQLLTHDRSYMSLTWLPILLTKYEEVHMTISDRCFMSCLSLAS